MPFEMNDWLYAASTGLGALSTVLRLEMVVSEVYLLYAGQSWPDRLLDNVRM